MTAVLVLAVLVGGGVGVVLDRETVTQVEGLLQSVSVGPAGVWGVNSTGEIYYRAGTFNIPFSAGSAWIPFPGILSQLDVGTNVVWGVDINDRIFYRPGINCTNPTGEGWFYAAGALKHISVDNDGQVWGVNADDNIYMRLGISYSNPQGRSWKLIRGSLKQISAGDSGVWGVNANDDIFYRTGTRGIPFSAGINWKKVSGSLKYISSASNNRVIGVNANDEIFIRLGVSDSNPTGTSWEKQDDGLRLKVVDAFDDQLYWGVDSDDNIFLRW